MFMGMVQIRGMSVGMHHFFMNVFMAVFPLYRIVMSVRMMSVIVAVPMFMFYLLMYVAVFVFFKCC